MPGSKRAWAIVATMFLAQMATIGLVSFGYGILIKPLTAEFGISRGAASLGLMAS
jgi:hypothetical protein